MSGKLYVLIRTHESQHDPHRNWESPPRRITHDVRRGKRIFFSASPEFTPGCGEHIPHPFRLPAICEGNDEAVRKTLTGVL